MTILINNTYINTYGISNTSKDSTQLEAFQLAHALEAVGYRLISLGDFSSALMAAASTAMDTKLVYRACRYRGFFKRTFEIVYFYQPVEIYNILGIAGDVRKFHNK